jgi:hypothetical protein
MLPLTRRMQMDDFVPRAPGVLARVEWLRSRSASRPTL